MAKYYDRKNLKLIGKVLKQRRIDVGLSRGAMTELTDFNINTIRNIEMGKEFSLSYFLKICSALNISPSSIFEDVVIPSGNYENIKKLSSKSITRNIHILIQQDFFRDYKKTREVQKELIEKFEIEISSKALSAVLIRMVEESHLKLRRKGRINIYKKDSSYKKPL